MLALEHILTMSSGMSKQNELFLYIITVLNPEVIISTDESILCLLRISLALRECIRT